MSPNGDWLVLRVGGASPAPGQRDVVGFRPGVDSAMVSLVATADFDEEAFAMSPDGRWLAYHSDETGSNEVFVRSFPDTDANKRQVSNGGGVAPLWARDGQSLFFVDSDRNMITVPVTTTDSLRLGEPRRLFRLPDDAASEYNFYTPWDIGADGRFIMVRRVAPEATSSSTLIIVENFFEELKAKVKN